VSLEMHLEAEIELNTVMDLEAVIKWVWRCICRPRLSNSVLQFEAVIEQVCRCTWRV